MRRVLRRTAAPPEDALEELSFQQARLEEALRQAHDAGRQLEQAQRMEAVGTLASGITHDLNNILTAIRGFAELATDSLPDEHPARADLDAIVQEQERASATIQQLLAFGRRQEASDERVELGELARKTARMLQPLVGAGRELVTRIDPRPCTVAGDRGQLEQVLVNLVVNACDAMPKGGRVTIETEAGPDCVCLSVRDTGSGMDEKTLGRIFEPFFTTKPRGKGTGLGLAAAFGIVKGNGGTIDVESAPGGGSLFVVRLPFAPKDSEPGLSG
jgi:signal transduction histidine kinase